LQPIFHLKSRVWEFDIGKEPRCKGCFGCLLCCVLLIKEFGRRGGSGRIFVVSHLLHGEVAKGVGVVGGGGVARRCQELLDPDLGRLAFIEI
jgi:hypothetical protein